MRKFLVVFIFMFCTILFSQQVADSNFNPPIESPTYKKGQGSVVFIDAGHNNFHTKEGRYKSFSNLLERDGYNVESYAGIFERTTLDEGKILVISNAIHESDLNEWVVPNPSAFTTEEIEVVQEWVYNGGSLFLIADHMPMAGAASDLASAFGFQFTNGFVLSKKEQGPTFFSNKSGSLTDNLITKGNSKEENVDQILTFTGQAFKIPDKAVSILNFTEGFINMLPDTAWVFNDRIKTMNPTGWSQGAYLKYGNGKIVVFGEAAMFSAQLAGPNKIKMGMNHPLAGENYQLLLNIIHWLDDKLIE